MMSDESDGTSFPAVQSGPAGRMPDNPPGPPEGVTIRRPRRIHPDTPDPRVNRPLSWKEWLAVKAGFGGDHRPAAPAYVNTFRSPRGSPAPQMDSPDQAEASLSDQERSGTNIDHLDREGNYLRHSGSEIEVLEYSDNSRSNNRNPDLNRHYPDLPRDHPDLYRHYPDHPRDHPDLPDTSERGHMSPGAHPDHPRANPDHPRDHPDLPRHNPDLPKVHPDHPRDHPDLPDTAERSHRSPMNKIDLKFKRQYL